ncbi:MAG: MFS transporter [Sphingomonadaceae bacterium]
MSLRPPSTSDAQPPTTPISPETRVAQAAPDRLAAPIHEGRLLALLVGTMFLVVTNINMMAPLLVDFAADFHTSVGAMGQLAAASAVPWAILAPFMGALSDRFGRRPVLATGLAILGLTTILSALAWDYYSLLMIRVIGGMGGASTGPSVMSSAADYFPANQRGRALGWVLAAVSLATVVGVPLVAMAAAYAGWRLAFIGLGLLLLAIGASVLLTFPRAKPPKSRQGSPAELAAVLADHPTRLLLLSNVMERASFTTVATYLAAFLMQSYGLRLDQVAPALSATAIGTLIGSAFGGRMADNRKRKGLVFGVFQSLAALIALPLFLSTPGVVPTAALGALFGLANSLARPAWLWLVSQAPESRRGATMGFTATTNQVGLMVGAAVGGLLLGSAGYQSLGWLVGAASITSAAICYCAARSVSPRLRS